MFIIFEYILFFFQANTAHGIHSPFVYDMVSNCLRKNDVILPKSYWYSEEIPQDTLRLINRIIHYYQLIPLSTQINKQAKLYILKTKTAIQTILATGNENQWILVLGIRSSPKRFQEWKEYIQSDAVTVSIDLFDIGLLINRREQPKQCFKLKAIR